MTSQSSCEYKLQALEWTSIESLSLNHQQRQAEFNKLIDNIKSSIKDILDQYQMVFLNVDTHTKTEMKSILIVIQALLVPLLTHKNSSEDKKLYLDLNQKIQGHLLDLNLGQNIKFELWHNYTKWNPTQIYRNISDIVQTILTLIDKSTDTKWPLTIQGTTELISNLKYLTAFEAFLFKFPSVTTMSEVRIIQTFAPVFDKISHLQRMP